MAYYDPNDINGEHINYIYSRTGITRIRPLSTHHFYVGGNGGSFRIFIFYGNTFSEQNRERE